MSKTIPIGLNSVLQKWQIGVSELKAVTYHEVKVDPADG